MSAASRYEKLKPAASRASLQVLSTGSPGLKNHARNSSPNTHCNMQATARLQGESPRCAVLSGFLQTQWVSRPMLSQVFGVPSLLKFFGSSAALSPQVFFSSGNLPVPRSSRTSTHSAPRSCPNLGMLVAVSTYAFPYHTSGKRSEKPQCAKWIS